MNEHCITAQELTALREGRQLVNALHERLADILSPQVASSLQSACEHLKGGLARLDAAERAARDRLYEYWSEIRSKHGFAAIWSTGDGGLDCTAKHPYEGAKTVCYKEHWGNDPVFVELRGDTWLDLYRASDEAIRLSGDGHHIFIERFRAQSDGPLILDTGA